MLVVTQKGYIEFIATDLICKAVLLVIWLFCSFYNDMSVYGCECVLSCVIRKEYTKRPDPPTPQTKKYTKNRRD